MNSNDLNQLLNYLTARDGVIIFFSEEDVKYLKEETDIKVYRTETDDVSLNKMKAITKDVKYIHSRVVIMLCNLQLFYSYFL